MSLDGGKPTVRDTALVTAGCLRDLADGAEVELARDALVTPLAHEEACRRGIRLLRPPGSVEGRLSELARRIDHTLLAPGARASDLDRLCDEALAHRFASVCVNGIWVRRCAEILEGADVAVCAVVGFPLGASLADAKAFEARRAIEDGASEIDMVLSVGALRAGDGDAVAGDVATVARVCRERGALLKVILETGLLTDAEKVRGCRLACSAGADFVKTSTGFGPGGATALDVALMRRTVGPETGVKASGGIRDTRTAWAMIEAGATRLGTSQSVAIVEGA